MDISEITRYELIGSMLEVTSSRNKNLVGTKGKIIDETKNMFILENGKKLIKSQSTFIIKIDNKKFQIKGELLVGKPEDRLKKKIK